MSRRVSDAELLKREAAIRKALSRKGWHRPIAIAERANLEINATIHAIKRMEQAGQLQRRECRINTLRGRYRKRLASRVIVEYRLVDFSGWALWPASLYAGLAGCSA